MFSQVRQDAGLFALLLEPFERPLEALVIVYDDFWHSLIHPSHSPLRAFHPNEFGNLSGLLFACKLTSVAVSTGWPAQFPTTENMQMKVIDALAGVLAGVRDDAVPVTVQAELARRLRGESKQAPQQFFAIHSSGIPHGSNVPGGNDQHVHRRLRIDIPKRHCVLGAFDDLRRDLAGYDLAKQTISHGLLAS
jgi:hypothetical protein